MRLKTCRVDYAISASCGRTLRRDALHINRGASGEEGWPLFARLRLGVTVATGRRMYGIRITRAQPDLAPDRATAAAGLSVCAGPQAGRAAPGPGDLTFPSCQG